MTYFAGKLLNLNKINNLKTIFLLIALICVPYVQGQEKDLRSRLDSMVQHKEKDFNTIFLPLYNQKDTLDYRYLMDISRKNNFILGEIIALNLLGTHYRDQAAYAKSVQLHLEALSISEKTKLTDGILYSNNMLGVVYRRMDNVSKGLEYHFKALELAEEIKPVTDFSTRNTAIAVNGIGNAYLILEEYESARKQFRRSLEIEKSIDNTLGLAINNQNIGITFEETNAPDSALIHYRNSLSYNNIIQNKVGQMICYNSIAGVLITQQKYLEALRYIDLAESIAVENGDSFYTATIYLKKAKILTELGRNVQAFDYLEKSRTISTKHDLQTNLAETYEALSNYHASTGNFEEALQASRLSKEVQLNYLNENNLRIKNNLEISYDVESKMNEILALEEEKEDIMASVAQKQRLILALGLLLGLLVVIGFLLFQQSRLSKEKQKLELEQKVLRAQMNPHFTFNALNSIKSYIISEDTESAVKYLNRFSKLIRGVLHSSDKRFNTLAEELEMVDSYVAIEKLRFSDPIDLSIHINGINTSAYELPPLILQPFIENALWHGLAKKEGEKKIRIDVVEKDKCLWVEITDNGVGRDLAQMQDDHQNHKSFGVHISHKRLENHFNFKPEHSIMEYTDLKDNAGNPAGTKVSLCFPVSS